MKRSQTVTLVLVGAAAFAGAYVLERSDKETEAGAFHSVDECRNSGLDASTCQASFDNARKTHETDAPRFQSQEDCERDFGAGHCNNASLSAPGGGIASYFVPALVGFAVARALTNQAGQPASQPLYGCPPDRQRPDGSCYSTSTGHSFYSGYYGGSSGSRSASSTTALVPSSTFSRSGTGSTVVARGGSVASVSRGDFGSAGHGFSGSSS